MSTKSSQSAAASEYSDSSTAQRPSAPPGGKIAQAKAVIADFFVVSGQYLGFLRGYAARHKALLIWAFALSVPLAGLSAAIALLAKAAIEAFQNGGEKSGSLAPVKTIIGWVLLYLLITVARSVLEIVNRYLLTRLDAKTSLDIRTDLYDSIQDSPLSFHVASRGGELTSLISNDVQVASSGIVEIFSGIWLNPFTVIVLLCVMFYYNPLLSLLGFLSLPVIGFFVTAISKLSRKKERRFLQLYANIIDVMTESMTNVKQVKALSAEDRQSDKMLSAGRQLVKSRCEATLVKSLVNPATEITGGLSLALMLLLAHYQITHGISSYENIAAALVAALSIKRPIKQISNSLVNIQRSVAASQRIMWVMPQKTAPQRPLREDISTPVSQIELKDVAFSYDGRNAVLEGVSATLNRGERVAICGHSGAGKTTLIDLIIGFYPCSGGHILVDSVDLAEFTPGLWRRQIGIVTQDPFLFNMSLKENILYGCESASQESFDSAVAASGVGDFLDELPEGLETPVGQRGERLSGGQRKRVALARALVRPISVLILDEVTSELDEKAINSLLAAVDALSQKMLIIHVSHNPAVIDHCDRFMLLRDKTLTEVSSSDLRSQMTRSAAQAGRAAGRAKGTN